MNRLFEMHIRLGGDPRGEPEYTALCAELAKLKHPACPDVDWLKVERLCLTLFGKVGVDLQTAATYTLARGHLYLLEGVVEGVGLIEKIIVEGNSMWPPGASSRLNILTGLFSQLLPMLRGMPLSNSDLERLIQLDAVLGKIQQRLAHHAEPAVATLQVFRQQLGALMTRLGRCGVKSPALLTTLSLRDEVVPALFPAIAWVILPSEPMAGSRLGSGRKKRSALWVLMSLTIFICVAVLSAALWLTGLTAQTHAAPDPIQLNGLRLFDAGSAELHVESDKLLIGALIEIKAKPGWLVMITGHSDATGNAQANRQLSLARAASVRDWMQTTGGIPDSCLVIQGVAATQPVSGVNNAAGRAANRRVDIRLVPQEKPCGEMEQA